jgi:formylglycine-generating enzyme required for sulfatase activity
MRLFLSYASEDRAQVEPIRLALTTQGHKVFFDRDSLPPGEEFDARIREAIEGCELFIVLLSPNSVGPGRYTHTEADIAAATWPNPAGHILPVMLRPVPLEQVPAYLKAVTVLETDGNVAAAVSDRVHRIAVQRRRLRFRKRVLPVVAVVLACFAGWFYWTHGGDTSGKDGAPAVLISGGQFRMGDGENSPLRDAYVDSFYLDSLEVTVSRYARFLAATGSQSAPDYWDEAKLPRDADLPVVGVDWNDADAYCKWAGKRLPTEAEWEKAARGKEARLFPWGAAQPTVERAVFGRSGEHPYQQGVAQAGTHVAGRSPEGVADLAGNVSEWMSDWYTDTFLVGNAVNPRGPDTGTGRVIRGGGWDDPAQRLQSALRFYASPDTRADDIGFRCARNLH